MTARLMVTAALAVLMVAASWELPPVFARVAAVGGVVLLVRFGLLGRVLGDPRRRRLRKALNISVAVLLWLLVLVQLGVVMVPLPAFLAVALWAGVWFLFDQPTGRVLDMFYAGAVGLLAVIGLALQEDPGTLWLLPAALVGGLLLGALGVLDRQRILVESGGGMPRLALRKEVVHVIITMLVAVGTALGIGMPAPGGLAEEVAGSGSPVPVTAEEDRVREQVGPIELGRDGDLPPGGPGILRVRLSAPGRWASSLQELPGGLPRVLLRGHVLTWLEANRLRPNPAPSTPDRYGEPRGLRFLRVRQRVRLYKGLGPRLPALAPVVEVVAGRGVILDGTGGVRRREPAWEGFTYEVVSRVLHPEARRRLEGHRVRHPGVEYLRLPDDLDPRIRGLAEEVAGDLENPYRVVRAVERFLLSRFRYARHDPNKGPDPLATFLLESRRGHCTYFAVGMVALLRSLGLPARVVGGYGGGIPGRPGEYVFRGEHAHAWVEVPFQGVGWIPFDPTPAGGEEAEGAPAAAPARSGSSLSSWTPAPLLVAGPLLAAGCLVLAFWLRRRRSRGRSSRAAWGGSRTLALSVVVRQLLARAGAVPRPQATLLELLEEAALPGELVPELDRVIHRLYRARFGGRPLDERERRRMRAVLRHARTRLKAGAGAAAP